MKKRYSSMEAIVIPINNSIETSGNCIITTMLEDSSGDYNARCDATPDDYIQREWFGNNVGLQVLLTIEECY